MSEESVIQIIAAFIGAAGAIIAALINRRRTIQKPEQGGSTMATRIRRFITTKVFIFFLAPLLGMVMGWGIVKVVATDALEIKAPFEVSNYFYPSGWMGDGEDGEEGEKYIQLNDQWRENCHSAPTCIRITYRPNKKGWAGIYWQFPDGNWGDSPGRRIKGASRLTFLARGERGGELVQFKAGGIFAQGKKYHDSFEIAISPVELTQEWQRYEIDFTRADLSSVLGAFAWTANRSGNPEGLTFYLDDIRYEKE